MSKSRVSGDGRSPRQSDLKATPLPSVTAEVHRFIGVSLGGGKTDKACVAVVEYFPKYRKVFLSRLFERIKSDDRLSADLQIHEIIEQYRGAIECVSFDVPLQMPFCITCQLQCPGYENCTVSHIEWMWGHYLRTQKKKKAKKLFTPYTERSVEMYLATELEEPFILQSALGANMAPLTARARFIARRLKVPMIEVFPKLSIWRIGRSLHVMKSHLRFHKHALGGDEARRSILQALSTHNVVFVYEQDVKSMVANNHAFEAFIGAMTAFLKFKGQTEPSPQGFPENEAWVEFPKENIKWDKI